ncbi:MAG: DUF3343 domain-containing protein [Methylocystaceae bacterium]
MGRSIFNSKVFGVITFDTTSQALRAEKLLQTADQDFVMIPTPREITASCGLAVKIYPEDMVQVQADLRNEGVIISGVYQIDKSTGQTRLQALDAQ